MSFFSHDDFIIDQKLNLFRFGNTYQVLNNQNQTIGRIQQILTGFQKFLRLLIHKKNLPFLFQIQNADGQVEASIERGWSFFGYATVSILDANGQQIGTIERKFTFVTPTFEIKDRRGALIAKITGNWIAWTFKIENPQGETIGTIDKNWAGLAMEMFSFADKYRVRILENYPEAEHKAAILLSAVTIDMLLKESEK